MKVSDFNPLYGLLWNFDYFITINGEPIKLIDLKELHQDYELNEIQLEQLDLFDISALQRVLKEPYFTSENVIPYLRDILNNYAITNDKAVEWLYFTLDNVSLNPQNYRPDLITIIEKSLIEWIEIFKKKELYFSDNTSSQPQEIDYTKYTKHNGLNANSFALAYLFKLHAYRKSIPTNEVEGTHDAKEIKRIGAEVYGFNNTKDKGDTFYRAVLKCLDYDLNNSKELDQLSIENYLKGVQPTDSELALNLLAEKVRIRPGDDSVSMKTKEAKSGEVWDFSFDFKVEDNRTSVFNALNRFSNKKIILFVGTSTHRYQLGWRDQPLSYSMRETVDGFQISVRGSSYFPANRKTVVSFRTTF